MNPTERGLNIPVNMAFAFHSDAGTTLNDSIIGTLGIYYTNAYNEKFANGASRYLSHDLTDLIQSNIVRDVRTLYEPQWTRRGKWNQSYYEARVPRVPTMLLELLSHQKLCRHALRTGPAFPFHRKPRHLQRYASVPLLTIQHGLCSATVTGRPHGLAA